MWGWMTLIQQYNRVYKALLGRDPLPSYIILATEVSMQKRRQALATVTSYPLQFPGHTPLRTGWWRQYTTLGSQYHRGGRRKTFDPCNEYVHRVSARRLIFLFKDRFSAILFIRYVGEIFNLVRRRWTFIWYLKADSRGQTKPITSQCLHQESLRRVRLLMVDQVFWGHNRVVLWSRSYTLII